MYECKMAYLNADPAVKKLQLENQSWDNDKIAQLIIIPVEYYNCSILHAKARSFPKSNRWTVSYRSLT